MGLSRFDLTTQSDAESINAKFVKERSLPRFDILQQIEISIMETIQDRRQLAAERLAKVTPDTMPLLLEDKVVGGFERQNLLLWEVPGNSNSLCACTSGRFDSCAQPPAYSMVALPSCIQN